MRWVRSGLNAGLQALLPLLDRVPAEYVGRSFRGVHWVLARAGLPLPESIDPRLVRSTIRIVAESVVRTPYGQPLAFQEPLLVTLSSSTYCPFRCVNCYSNASAHGGTDAVPDAPRPWIDELAQSDVPFVFLTGGEPLADPRIEATAETLLAAGKWVYVSSNASIARLLALNRRYPHSLYFYLPLWGTPARHDELRGVGSYRRLCDNLRLLSDAGLAGNLLVPMSSADLGVIDTAAELAASHRISMVRINRKVSVGREGGDTVDATPAFLQALGRSLAPLKKRVDAVSLDLPETRRGARHPALLRALGIAAPRGCAAGSWMMHVDHRGHTYPCYAFEGSLSGTDATVGSLRERWRGLQQDMAGLGYAHACIGEAHARSRSTRVIALNAVPSDPARPMQRPARQLP